MKSTEWILKLQDKVSASLGKLTGTADAVSRKFDGLQSKIKQTENIAQSFGSKFASFIVGAGLVAGLGSLTGKVFELTAQQQKYSAVLTNSLGSQAASNDALMMLQDFAKTTPYELNQVTESFTKMVNRGMLPTTKQLTAMGDLAAASGKDLGMLTEALLDAQTGEFERLKEFGIKASVAGDKVTFMFKNQATTVANNAGAINAYMMSLGNLNGVQSTMASQMQTLGGKVSNIQDGFAQLLITVGVQLLPVFDFFLNLMTTLIDNAPIVADVLYGITAALAVMGAGWLAVRAYTIYYTIAQWLANASLAAFPVTWIVAAIALVIGAIVLMWNRLEWFRGGLMGIWEAAKFVFQSVAQMAKHYLTGVAELLIGIFNFDVDKIKSGVKNLGAAFSGVGDIAKGIGEKYQLGFEKGSQQVKDRLADQKSKNNSPTGAYQNLVDANQNMANTASGRGTKGAGATKKGIEGVAGGGSQVKNITINIQSLIKENKIIANNVTEGTDKTIRILEEAMIRLIQGAENVAN